MQTSTLAQNPAYERPLLFQKPVRSDSHNAQLIFNSIPLVMEKANQVAWENKLSVTCQATFIQTVQAEATDIVVASAKGKTRHTRDEVLDMIAKLLYIYAVVFEETPFVMIRETQI